LHALLSKLKERTLWILRNRYRASPFERILTDQILAKKAPRYREGPLIALESLGDPFFLRLFGEIVSALRMHTPIRVEQILPNSLNIGEANSFREWLSARLHYNVFTDYKIARLYATFCDRITARAGAMASPWSEMRYRRQAREIADGLTSKADLAALELQGIPVGDLVIDSYLRFRPAPELDVKDPYLKRILHQALKDAERTRRYFRKYRPRLYLTNYTSYIQHGIPARMALAEGIEVLSFGNLQEFAHRVTSTRPKHTRDTANYRDHFLTLPDQPQKFAMAEEAWKHRLSGMTDRATAYMGKSAYGCPTSDLPNVKDTAVIFLHDFYDSLHIYNWLTFHDFWEWACFSIETLTEAGVPFYVKPHPNQGVGSAEEIARLKRKYPDLRFLPQGINNRQLVEAGIACAITVYGSVAAEMAFLGVPSISCGDSPHASFPALLLAHNRAEYQQMLQRIPSMAAEKHALHQQACMFYYMHNLDLTAEQQELQDAFVTAWTHFMKLDENACPATSAVDKMFNAIANTAGFQAFIAELTTYIRGSASLTHGGISKCLPTVQS